MDSQDKQVPKPLSQAVEGMTDLHMGQRDMQVHGCAASTSGLMGRSPAPRPGVERPVPGLSSPAGSLRPGDSLADVPLGTRAPCPTLGSARPAQKSEECWDEVKICPRARCLCTGAGRGWAMETGRNRERKAEKGGGRKFYVKLCQHLNLVSLCRQPIIYSQAGEITDAALLSVCVKSLSLTHTHTHTYTHTCVREVGQMTGGAGAEFSPGPGRWWRPYSCGGSTPSSSDVAGKGR